MLDIGDGSEGVDRASRCLLASECANCNAVGDAVVSFLYGGEVLFVCKLEIGEIIGEIAKGSGVRVVSDGDVACCDDCS